VSPYAEVTAGVQNWFMLSVKDLGAVVAGADVASAIQRESHTTYTATAVATEDFVHGPIALADCAQRFRVTCRESGNQGAPGTCHVVVMFGGDYQATI